MLMLRQSGPSRGILYRVPALAKMGAGLLVILVTLLAPERWTGWFVGVGILLVLAILVSGVPVHFFLKRLFWLAPLILGVALANSFEPAARARAVALRSSICLLTVLVVSSTSSLNQVLRVLRLLRVPPIFVTTLALMSRYLVVLMDESERMRRARVSRTLRSGRWTSWRSLGTVLSQLFVRSSERAERVYQAMCARGWK